MSLQMYNTNVLSSAAQLVVLTKKFTVNLATGVVTTIEGKRVGVTAGVGTGVLTVTLPQIFRFVPCVQAMVIDSGLTGAQMIVTSDVTNVATTGPTAKSQFTATLTKLTAGAPTAVTTGTYTVGLCIIASA